MLDVRKLLARRPLLFDGDLLNRVLIIVKNQISAVEINSCLNSFFNCRSLNLT